MSVILTHEPGEWGEAITAAVGEFLLIYMADGMRGLVRIIDNDGYEQTGIVTETPVDGVLKFSDGTTDQIDLDDIATIEIP
jgi:hypothetical protein